MNISRLNLIKCLGFRRSMYLSPLGPAYPWQYCKRLTHNNPHTDCIRPSLHTVLDTRFNKGLAFTMKERQLLGVNGLWPCSTRSPDEQLFGIRANFEARKDPIVKYSYLQALRGRHERLYFRFLSEYTELVLPIIYTPTVGTVCSTFGLIFRSPVGLYITIYDRGHIVEVLQNWRETNIRAICVTDGGRILGLGDLGASGMGISTGKLALYTALGGIPPNLLLAVALDVGTDNEQLLADPLYVGARIKRVKGPEYDDLVQEFMDAVVEVFGPDTFIHFEDFATPNAFKFIRKYQHCFSCFNDDIQGTGSSVLAGFLGVEKVTNHKLNEHVFLFAGAGSASMGIANLLVKELMDRGIKEEDACKNIYVHEAGGLVTQNIPNLVEDLKRFAKKMDPIAKLEDTVEKIKPSILVGATGVGNLFNEQVLRSLAKNHKQPAVFALSNPTSKSECTAEQAYKFTEGRVIFSAGSPFPPVLINEKRLTPGQANNCLVYPGIALGVLSAHARYVPDEVYTIAAYTLANYTTEENRKAGSLYPAIKDANDVAFAIGLNVAKYIFKKNLSNLHPIPEDVCEYLSGFLYRPHYEHTLPNTWEYPKFQSVPLDSETVVKTYLGDIKDKKGEEQKAQK
ncbi:NADP-dependent malic enzyme-like [Scaptodrosophila lebanonensis]|uniref:NADP-dependent malic enzyme-like n=1 Tax=Drosophila lebanonensis TaxID=7225 RepID=A0A6J2U6U9_DROLE|nr:NADP-dependent malic enzyme-like [Scaptodrosophila lebanonensis]